MINLQDIENKEPIIKDFFTWLFDDEKISLKNIDIKKEVDLSLAPHYMDSNIYFPTPIYDFFQTKAMKRLGRVSQLSLVTNDYPVYHTRLNHSKGAYNRALEEMIYSFQNPDWKNYIENNNLKLYIIANLFKVAGHDIGHLPLSHALEEAIYKSHEAHEILGQRIMLENEKIQAILTSISPELPNTLRELFEKDIFNLNIHCEGSYDVDRLDYLSRDSLYLGFPKDIKTQSYEMVRVQLDSIGQPLLANDNSVIKSDFGNSFIDVYNYDCLKDIEDFLDLRFSLYQDIYMSKNSKMYESAINTFINTFLSTDSECGKDLRNFILQLQNSDIATCDLSEFLEWDDITLYSQIFEIGENCEDTNICDLASIIIPNMKSFLNMLYCHFDIKNTTSYSTKDLAFLKKIKHIIKSSEKFSRNLRNLDFAKKNTLLSTENHSLSSHLNSDLLSTFSYNLSAYKRKEPIYIKDKSGKIFELSKHPERRCNWDEKKIFLQYQFCYIPLLRFKGYTESEINSLRNIFSPSNPEANALETMKNRTVNMQPLQVGHNIEDCFLEL